MSQLKFTAILTAIFLIAFTIVLVLAVVLEPKHSRVLAPAPPTTATAEAPVPPELPKIPPDVIAR